MFQTLKSVRKEIKIPKGELGSGRRRKRIGLEGGERKLNKVPRHVPRRRKKPYQRGNPFGRRGREEGRGRVTGPAIGGVKSQDLGHDTEGNGFIVENTAARHSTIRLHSAKGRPLGFGCLDGNGRQARLRRQNEDHEINTEGFQSHGLTLPRLFMNFNTDKRLALRLGVIASPIGDSYELGGVAISDGFLQT